jgi:hypothetical protein
MSVPESDRCGLPRARPNLKVVFACPKMPPVWRYSHTAAAAGGTALATATWPRRCARAADLGTLLIDLLTKTEEREDVQTARLRFDIGLLAERVAGASDWLKQDPATAHLRIGYFGASTGAAAALVAAAGRPDDVGAVVSRGGRPDPGDPCTCAREGPNSADRGRRGPSGHRHEPRSPQAPERRKTPGNCPWGHPPL